MKNTRQHLGTYIAPHPLGISQSERECFTDPKEIIQPRRLMVMVTTRPDDNLPHRQEDRRRRRHAIELAMFNAGFSPVRRFSGMNFLRCDEVEHENGEKNGQLVGSDSILVPFRIFKNSGGDLVWCCCF